MDFPLKRFIREGCRNTREYTRGDYNPNNNLIGISGEEIHEFYTSLVGMENTSPLQHTKPVKLNKKENNIKSRDLRVFNLNEFYRCAVQNKPESLRRFDYEQGDIDIQDNYGWTALMMAACAGALESVNVLLSLGANANIKDKSGKTAKDLAEKKGYFHIREILNCKNIKSKKAKTTKDEDASTEFNTFIKPEFYYCNICEMHFQETPRYKHLTSTIHQFNSNYLMSKEKLQRFNVPSGNKGFQLMVKQGWDKKSGLGPTRNGRLYPIKTTIRKPLSGLGIEQPPPRVTHHLPINLKKLECSKKRKRSHNDMRSEKFREWKRDRRLRQQFD